MDLFKDIKFQVAVVALIVAAVHFFLPDVDEASLIDIVTTLVALIFGGQAIAEKRRKKE